MNILGIDQSYTSSGYYVCDGVTGKYVSSGLIKTEKDVNIFDRAQYITDEIVKYAILYDAKRIGIEGLAFSMRGNATRDLAGLQFMIICALKKNNFDVDIWAPPTVKKFATGSGKASKKDMFAAVPEDIQHLFTDTLKYLKTKGLYDVTDSYFIAKLSEDDYNNQMTPTPAVDQT